jgi:hypothetical protein
MTAGGNGGGLVASAGNAGRLDPRLPGAKDRVRPSH